MTKQLKIYYLSQNRWNRTIAIPKIQLAGIWLRQAGFQIGDQINVEYGNGKITISNLSQAAMPDSLFM